MYQKMIDAPACRKEHRVRTNRGEHDDRAHLDRPAFGRLAGAVRIRVSHGRPTLAPLPRTPRRGGIRVALTPTWADGSRRVSAAVARCERRRRRVSGYVFCAGPEGVGA